MLALLSVRLDPPLMVRKNPLEVFLGHLAELGARPLGRIASGFGYRVLGFLVVVIHGTAPFLDTDGVRRHHFRAKPPKFSRGPRAGRKPRSARSAAANTQITLDRGPGRRGWHRSGD